MDATEHKKSFGERLRRARLMRGLSLRELAARLEASGKTLSHGALQKYEEGKMAPNSGMRIALCEVFHLETGYFFRRSEMKLATLDFRKRTAFPKKEQARVREEALDYFERYQEIEAILEQPAGELIRIDLSEADPSHMATLLTSAEEAATQVRLEWKLGEDALPNVQEMLEEHGVKVKEVAAAESFDGFSGWANGTMPVMALASWLNQDLPRKRFTALHELGHLVMKLPPALADKAVENLCHRFASAMLVPAEAMRRSLGAKRSDGISAAELKGMKEDWGISIAALMRRAADLEIITPSRLKSFYFLKNQNGPRKAEPGIWCGAERANRFSQLVYRAAAQELITRGKAAELLGLTHREFDRSFAAEI
jgi:Zn-dependent peptidase ImmA (M78 family)/DNA-binding XRE family transcriptional regulator